MNKENVNETRPDYNHRPLQKAIQQKNILVFVQLVLVIASQKLGETKCLTLGEQQYFVWDTASPSTK